MVTHLVQAVNFVWLTGGHRHLKKGINFERQMLRNGKDLNLND